MKTRIAFLFTFFLFSAFAKAENEYENSLHCSDAENSLSLSVNITELTASLQFDYELPFLFAVNVTKASYDGEEGNLYFNEQSELLISTNGTTLTNTTKAFLTFGDRYDQKVLTCQKVKIDQANR